MQMVRFVHYQNSSKLYKVIFETEEVVWLISWDSPSAPIKVGVPNELVNAPMPDEFLSETIPSEKRKKAMEKRYNLLRPLIETDSYEYICDSSARRKKIHEIAQTSGLSEKTLTRQYFAYLAKGKNGLLPASRTAAINSPEKAYLDSEIQKAINKYYYSPRKLSLQGAYELYLVENWKGEDGKLRPDAPDFAQFKRNYRQVRSEYKNIISRQGIGDYQKNFRPLLGSSSTYAKNCGLFEMDATEADVCIVSKYSRKPIGRPMVYLAVDVATRLITGFHVSLTGGSDAILLCFCSMVEDKVELCKRYDISIAPSRWPSIGLPKSISTDRGSDFMSGRIRDLCERFDIEITNLPAYRPDLKGCVEKAFDCLQSRYKPLLRGHGTIEIEKTRTGAAPVQTKACLDLSEYTKILLKCIIFYNSSRVLSFPREPNMVADNVKPVSASLWEWMVLHGRSDLIQTNVEDIKLMLLPRGRASITRSGLLFNGLRYDTHVFDMTPEYVDAGIRGNKKVSVAYNEDSTERIYLIRNGQYILFTLTTASIMYSNLSFPEVHLLQQEENEARKKAARDQIADAVECSDFIQKTLENAEKTEPHSLEDIKKEKMKEERRREIANGNDGQS